MQDRSPTSLSIQGTPRFASAVRDLNSGFLLCHAQASDIKARNGLGNMNNVNFSLLYSSSPPALRVYDTKCYILIVLYYCTCIYTVQSVWDPHILPSTHTF